MLGDKFENIEYLKLGNKKQKLAYEVLSKLQIFNILKNYKPILVGTIPLDIDTPASDLDIICEVYNYETFEKTVKQKYGNCGSFHIDRQIVRGLETSFSSFIYNEFTIEIFGQPKPVFEQNGYRHMIVEKKLIELSGTEAKKEIKKLKKSGMKTEPAFAKYFGLKGDSYDEVLKLSFLSEEELIKYVKQRIKILKKR